MKRSADPRITGDPPEPANRIVSKPSAQYMVMTANIYTASNGFLFRERAILGPVPEARVREAELTSGLRFPSTYRNFLLHIGAIGDIAGLPNPDPAEDDRCWIDVVEYNRSMRTDLHGIEHDRHLIYLDSDGGDAWYCLDSTRVDRDGEFSVVLFGPEHDPPVLIAKNFFEFLKMSYGAD